MDFENLSNLMILSIKRNSPHFNGNDFFFQTKYQKTDIHDLINNYLILKYCLRG